MPTTYFYIACNESGESIAEYVSSVPPPVEGATLNLRAITRKYNDVHVRKVEEFPLPGHTVVKIVAQLVA